MQRVGKDALKDKTARVSKGHTRGQGEMKYVQVLNYISECKINIH